MATNSFKVKNSLKIEAGGTATESGDLTVNSNELEFHNGTNAKKVATESNAIALTSKTIDADQNTITNIANASIKAAAAIALDKLAATTASRALASDASGFVTASATTATELGYVSGVTSAIQTQINNHLADTTTHGTTGDIVGTSDAQVLTNKDIDGGTAANTRRITIPQDTFANIGGLTRKEGTILYANDVNKFYGDDGSNLFEVGSGSGAGGINYIDNFNYETNASGITAYDDGSSATVVDGTGGSPGITFTRTTTNPLRDTGSLLLTKDAADRQGEGGAWEITIDATDQGKLLEFSADYTVASGTYVTGDAIIQVVDVTNSRVIWCTPYQIENTSTYGRIKCLFQTSIDSTSYRVCIHIATTSASAYTLKFDDTRCGPQVITYGAVIGAPVAWTPTGSWVANTTYTGEWTRVGAYAEYIVKVACTGAPTSASLTVNLPHTIDTARLLEDTGNIGHLTLGTADIVDTGSQYYNGFVTYNSTTSVIVEKDSSSGGLNNHGSPVTQVDPFTFANGDFVTLTFRVPVLGWSTSLAVSGVDAGDGRRVVAKLTGSTTTWVADTPTKAVFTTVVEDTHGIINGGKDQVTIPVSGDYRITANFLGGSVARVVNSSNQITVYKNGAPLRVIGAEYAQVAATYYMGTLGADTFPLVAGDVISIYFSQGNTGGANPGGADNASFCIERLQGASSIFSGETVSCRYKTAAGQSINNSSNTTVVFGTKSWDTHGAFNAATGVFTAPVAGKYAVQASLTLSSAGWTVATEQFAMITLVNGVNAEKMATHMSQATNTFETYITGGTTVDLVAGGTFAIQAYQTSGGAVNLQADANYNWIVITKVGV